MDPGSFLEHTLHPTSLSAIQRAEEEMRTAQQCALREKQPETVLRQLNDSMLLLRYAIGNLRSDAR